MSEIVLKNVTKNYGNVQGVSDITITLKPGITGILGPNGAGKSTLFKLLMGRLKPSSGNVRLFGVDPWVSTSPYRRVGYVAETEKLPCTRLSV